MKYLFAAYACLMIFTVAKAVNPSYLKFELGGVSYRERVEAIFQDSEFSDTSVLPTSSVSNPTQTSSDAITPVQTSKIPEPPSTETPGTSIWVFIGAGVGGVILLILLAAGIFFGVIGCRHYLREKAIRDRIREQREFQNNESGV
jgi:hypothetical protein